MTGEVNRPGIAIVAVLGATGLFGLIDNFMRLAAETGGLWQFHFLRSVVALALLVVGARVVGTSLRPKRPLNVMGRSCLNGSAMVIYFGGLGLMPIAQVVAGLFTAPLWVVLFSVVFFGERVGPRRIFVVLLGFAGIVLVLRPDAGAFSALTLVPVLAGAIYAWGNIATRRCCGGEGTPTLLGGFFGMMLVFGVLGVGVLALFPQPVPAAADGFILRGWVASVGLYGVMIVVQGVGSLIGVGLSIRACQLADATFVAVFENTLLLSATIWAVVLWGEIPDAPALLGLAMIAGAGVIIALRSDSPQAVRAVTLPE